MANGEIKLLSAVKRVVGPYLDPFSSKSSIPVAFWASLVAGESGRDIVRGVSCQDIQRKEPSAISRLCLLAAGFKPKSSLTTADLISELGELGEARRKTSYHLDQIPTDVSVLADLPLRMFIDYGSSWGFMQIMGYHALGWEGITLLEIRNPDTHFNCAAHLMNEFCERFGLDPRKEFEAMFRCWNTGNPTGQTYDSQYVANGLRRMSLWLNV